LSIPLARRILLAHDQAQRGAKGSTTPDRNWRAFLPTERHKVTRRVCANRRVLLSLGSSSSSSLISGPRPSCSIRSLTSSNKTKHVVKTSGFAIFRIRPSLRGSSEISPPSTRWKTTTSRYPDGPEGLLSLDPQLISYSWISGISEVALVRAQ